VLGVGAFGLSQNGWEMARLWLYLLVSALLVMNGIQLALAWLVMRVLEQLAQREMAARRDLHDTAPGGEQPKLSG